MDMALHGIRVVDFSWGWAGPMAAELLAYMGAEVIKVESSTRLDFVRAAPDPVTGKWEGPNRATTFWDANLNKMSVTINLKHPQGLDIAKKLIKISDIMLESFAVGVTEKLGLTYKIIKEIKPDIIMLSTTGHGQSGPESHYLGYAPLFAALGGVGDMTGYPDGPPSEIRASADAVSAYTAVIAIVAALIYRQRTGEGQYIDFSSREAHTCLIGEALMDYAMNGRVQTRAGNRDDIMAPHNCYRCKGQNKWVSIAIGNNEEWKAFCDAIGNPRWTKDKRFCDQLSRYHNQEALDELMEKWTLNHTHYHVAEILQKAGVAAVPSFTAEDIFSDPHLQERQFSAIVEHPEAGARITISCPWKLSATPPQIVHDAPLLGQHNEHVLTNILGLSREQVHELAGGGVLS